MPYSIRSCPAGKAVYCGDYVFFRIFKGLTLIFGPKTGMPEKYLLWGRFGIRLTGLTLKFATIIVMADLRKMLHPFHTPRPTHLGNFGRITVAVAPVEEPAIFAVLVCIAHFPPLFLGQIIQHNLTKSQQILCSRQPGQGQCAVSAVHRVFAGR
jgi:hypothetical protein